jgi:superfamily II DNA or RNA helicase
MIMHGVLSVVLMKKLASVLIREGWLVPCDIFIHKFRTSGYSRFSYKEAYKQIVHSPEFNTLVANILREEVRVNRRQTLCLVKLKSHGEILERAMAGEAIFLNGDQPIEYREKMKKLFVEKKIKCLIATAIFGEGQDIPSIDVFLNARLQESEIQTQQGIGRALRLAKGANNYEESVKLGKSRAIVHDFFVEGNSHLKRHSVSRLDQYRKEEEFKIKDIG